jgi:hypothetical protein
MRRNGWGMPARLRRKAAAIFRETKDRLSCTYRIRYDGRTDAVLAAYRSTTLEKELKRMEGWVLENSEEALAHRFDLLGSGKVVVRKGVDCPGFHGNRFTRNRPEGTMGRNKSASDAIAALIPPEYIPLDWQLDFRSGYRWQASRWSGRIAHAPCIGADIKVPWELGRMQHLPILAFAFMLAKAGSGGFRSPASYAGEFRNQVLDFIAANPPRFGVHWNCAMEAAIRVANWLVAREFFLSAGASFDPAFERILSESVHEHGAFIMANLEKYGQERNNHYLADLAGLAFVAAYLPSGPDTRRWTRWLVGELPSEISYQFNPEGSNFEGATAYHAFSAEMAAYGMAALSAACKRHSIPPPKTEECFSRFHGMGDFILGIAKPNGEIPQIGDNDSGRFLNLRPVRSDLDKSYAVAAASGIAPDLDPIEPGIEKDLVVRLMGTASLPGNRSAAPRISESPKDERSLESHFHAMGEEDSEAFEFGIPDGTGFDPRNTILKAYPEFGIYVIRGSGFYLAVRCGPNGSKGSRGHFHNDQLLVELDIGGMPVISDPGTYIYSALPDVRNRYRSVSAHFVPFSRMEYDGDTLSHGAFRLPEGFRSRCIHFGPEGFLGETACRAGVFRRGILIGKRKMSIIDTYRGDQRVPGGGDFARPGVPYANGYGKLDPSRNTVNPLRGFKAEMVANAGK